MRKLAYVLLAALGLAFVAHAQQRRSDGKIHIGSKDTDVVVEGNIIWTSPDGGSSHTPASGLTGAAVVKADVLDAGVSRFNGDTQFFGNPVCGSSAVCGSVALTSGTPSTATVTVRSGASCACWPTGNTAAIAAAGCATSVSSTTLTLTGPNSVTTTMRYFCWY